VLLVVRPQEAVAAVQSLGQANADFFTAVADYNRAQFRLYRALGHPAQCLAGAMPAAPAEPVAVPEAKPPAPPINAPVPTTDAPMPPANGPRAGPGSPLPLSPAPRIPSIEPIEPGTGAAEAEPRAPVGSVPNFSPGRGG
jgi:hypothetical protein